MGLFPHVMKKTAIVFLGLVLVFPGDHAYQPTSMLS